MHRTGVGLLTLLLLAVPCLPAAPADSGGSAPKPDAGDSKPAANTTTEYGAADKARAAWIRKYGLLTARDADGRDPQNPPLFLDTKELGRSGFSDYARIEPSTSYVGREFKTFVVAELLTGGVTYPVIEREEGKPFDIDLRPVDRVITPAILKDHFSEMVSAGKLNEKTGLLWLWNQFRIRTHPVFGVSTDKFGGSQTQGNKNAYFLGGGLMLNPYVSLLAGASVIPFGGKKGTVTVGTFGITLDLTQLLGK